MLPPLTGNDTIDAIIYGLMMLAAATAFFGAMGGGDD